jgi:hypothetical protein
MYLYETHLHTAQVSICANSYGRDYIKRYKDLGFQGIIVTDHFYNGNTEINKSLPWKKWVENFCRGYEDALNEGIKQGLDVFFGWEETFDFDDYLIYGLDKEWLLAHPESARWTRLQQYKTVKQYGGCVVHAHPFRETYYIPKIHLHIDCVDGIEVGNAGHTKSYDALALRYAQKLGLPTTAGSDIHSTNSAVKGKVFGVYLNKKMNGISDYVKAICENSIHSLYVPQGRLDYHGNETINTPISIRDANGKIISRNLQDFFNKPLLQSHIRKCRPDE